MKRTKSFLVGLLATLSVLSGSLGLVACGNPESSQNSSNTANGDSSDSSHEHEYAAVVTGPTCTEKGYTTHICACGESYVDTYVNALGHTLDDSGVCSICKEQLLSTKGVIFELSQDKTHAIVVGYQGNSKQVKIAETYNDLPVTTIGEQAFCQCGVLTSVEIPDSVTTIGMGAFYGCSSLTSVKMSDSVTTIGMGAFYGCNSLTSVKIPDNVTTIDMGAFYGCGNLTSVSIGDRVASIGDGAFSRCRSLISLTIPDRVTSIGSGAFYGCNSLKSITIGGSVTSIEEWAFQSCSSLMSVVIPSSVTSVADGVFYNCSSLTSVSIPDSVTSIGEQAFYNCESLTSVTIPDSVTSIGEYAFEDCYKLVEVVNKSTHIKVEKGSSDNGSVGRYALAVYSSDTFVSKISRDNGYIVYTDGKEKILLGYTGTETNLILPSYITKIYQNAFRDCSNLTSVVIPDSVTFIGERAFYNCDKLVEVVNKSKHITVEKGSKDAGYVGCYALAVYNSDDMFVCKVSNDNGYIVYSDGEEKILVCYAGTETDLTLPSYITKINQGAFNNCGRLTSITIPDSVTSIGEYAFGDCSSLTSVTIGNSVTSIGEGAFYGCYKLVEVVNRSTHLFYYGRDSK